jgi:hypothetical protein
MRKTTIRGTMKIRASVILLGRLRFVDPLSLSAFSFKYASMVEPQPPGQEGLAGIFRALGAAERYLQDSLGAMVVSIAL